MERLSQEHLDHENIALKNGHFATKLKMITLVGCEEAVLKYYFWNANEMQKTHDVYRFYYGVM